VDTCDLRCRATVLRRGRGSGRANMNQLVVHHTYAHGFTLDVSGNRNHGVITDVAPGPANDPTPHFVFAQPSSGIGVAPSPTLRNLVAIRARLRFRLEPAAAPQRWNLLEGHVSFALFVHPDRSIQGTIVDAAGAWRGPRSAAGVVVPNQWHEAELLHDGVSRIRVLLDGSTVAEAHDVRGPVRDIGAYGFAIGQWPDPPNPYTFRGRIGEVQLFRYDPRKDVVDLLDRCCAQLSALDGLVARLAEEGHTSASLQRRAHALVLASLATAADIREGDPDAGATMERVNLAAWNALLRKDGGRWRRLVRRFAAFAGPDRLAGLAEAAGDLPLSPEDAERVARALCLEHLLPDGHEGPDRETSPAPRDDESPATPAFEGKTREREVDRARKSEREADRDA
jgi:hypothetical protein